MTSAQNWPKTAISWWRSPFKTHHSIEDQSFWSKCIWPRGILKDVGTADTFSFLIYVFISKWLINSKFSGELKGICFLSVFLIPASSSWNHLKSTPDDPVLGDKDRGVELNFTITLKCCAFLSSKWRFGSAISLQSNFVASGRHVKPFYFWQG